MLPVSHWARYVVWWLATGLAPQPQETDYHGMEYLLTWNFKHIANAVMCGKIEAVCRDEGYEPPIICTPQELLGG